MPFYFDPETGLEFFRLTNPAGSNTQVQFNDGGVFGADADLVYNKTTNVLTSGSFQVGTAFPIKTLGNNNEIVIGLNAGSGVTNGAANSMFVGNNAGSGATAANDAYFFGTGAGSGASDARFSYFFGTGAGSSATYANNSNFYGFFAGDGATSANNSNFFGSVAGYQASEAYNSNFFGNGTGNGATYANNSNFFGAGAGSSATSANNSNFFGNNAGSGASFANDSNLIGTSAGSTASFANNSNFIGYFSGYGATDSVYSNFIGNNAGYEAFSASYSNFIGSGTGYQAYYASNSNFIGNNAGYLAENASNSIFIGLNSGDQDTVNNNSTLGFWSIAIGPYSGTGGFSNSIAIGRGVINSASLQMNFGNVLYGTGIYNSDTQSASPMAAGKLGVLTSSPTSTLHVAGSVTLNYRAISSASSLNSTDYTLNCTSGPYAITLPTAASITGRVYVIKNSDTGVITLNTTGGETVDGAASGTITLNQYDSLTLQSNGSNWIIL